MFSDHCETDTNYNYATLYFWTINKDHPIA